MDINGFITFLVLCCVFNTLVILWDFRLEYNEESKVERSIQEIIIYILLVCVSVFGTGILLIIMSDSKIDRHNNPIKYMCDKLENLGDKTFTFWEKKQ